MARQTRLFDHEECQRKQDSAEYLESKGKEISEDRTTDVRRGHEETTIW